MTTETLKYKNVIADYFKSQPILKAYLFGSVSRGDSRKDSDIDILVELDKQVDLFQLVSIKLYLEKILKKTVDLISTKAVHPRLKSSIDKDKTLIYEKSLI